jgi:hypothetical protein
MIALRTLPAVAACLLLPMTALATPGQVETAVEIPRPEPRPEPTSEVEILYRRLAFPSFHRYQDRTSEILERLWISGSPRYCQGLVRIGNNYKLLGEHSRAIEFYRRAAMECEDSGWVLLSLSEMARDVPGLCPETLHLLSQMPRDPEPGSLLPGPAAEGRWTRGELEYLGRVGASVVRIACRNARPDSRELRAIVDYRGRRAFGREASRVEAYVTEMMLADLNLRAGKLESARENLNGALRSACRSDAAVTLLVEAMRAEAEPALAFHVGLGAIGLLQQLWINDLLEEIPSKEQRCLREMLHSVRRTYRGDPEMERPEVRQWHAELDRTLREVR